MVGASPWYLPIKADVTFFLRVFILVFFYFDFIYRPFPSFPKSVSMHKESDKHTAPSHVLCIFFVRVSAVRQSGIDVIDTNDRIPEGIMEFITKGRFWNQQK